MSLLIASLHDGVDELNSNKHAAKLAASKFAEQFDGQFTLWGVCHGPAPSEYDEWGKPRPNIRNWAIHVYISDENEIDNIPVEYQGFPIMVFQEIKED